MKRTKNGWHNGAFEEGVLKTGKIWQRNETNRIVKIGGILIGEDSCFNWIKINNNLNDVNNKIILRSLRFEHSTPSKTGSVIRKQGKENMSNYGYAREQWK